MGRGIRRFKGGAVHGRHYFQCRDLLATLPVVVAVDAVGKEPDMTNCLFCKIVDGEIPSTKVYEDDDFLAFEDIHPKAPVHVLVIPKRHVPTLDDVGAGDVELLGRLMDRVRHVAKALDLAAGYRVVINVREEGGQEVFHLHVHILGGKRMPF